MPYKDKSYSPSPLGTHAFGGTETRIFHLRPPRPACPFILLLLILVLFSPGFLLGGQLLLSDSLHDCVLMSTLGALDDLRTPRRRNGIDLLRNSIALLRRLLRSSPRRIGKNLCILCLLRFIRLH